MNSFISELGRYSSKTGPTPLVPVCLDSDGPTIWCKLEFLNPSGSTKDRIARHILEKAWRRGDIRAGSRVIEASSGSTSIALALHCAQMGLKFTAVMPQGVSNERVWMIRAYGGEVEFVAKDAGIAGAIARADELARSTGAFASRQFTNPDNAEAHRTFTGQEILTQIPGGVVDAVASGVGTGGTIVGLYHAFRDAGCPVVPFAARPVTRQSFPDFECCSFSGRIPGVAEGISTLFRPDELPGLRTVEVADDLALEITRRLIARGFPVGPSSGLNYAAAIEASRALDGSERVVTVFPDRMERYFSTELFAGIKEV
ncbi:MAG: cysteine synthase family protein [Planctomycetes bacterium]|nr:cysteine synthase family protein [Planctomycetota bacterium]